MQRPSNREISLIQPGKALIRETSQQFLLALSVKHVKLSVIIPAYNRADLIRGTIDSILNCGQDELEIVVVDDGSTDQTSDVVLPLGPPVRYLRQDNQGLAAARNNGFKASCGKYVAFLDSDDLWLPGTVPAMTRLLDDHPDIPFIFGDASMGSPATGFVSFVGTFGGAAFRNLPSREVEPGVRRLDRGPFFRQLVRRNVVFLGSLVMRREVMEQVGPFDAYPWGAEDWHFFLRLALRHEYCYREGLIVATYLQHSSNMTKDGERMNEGFRKALERLLADPELRGDDRVAATRQFGRARFYHAYSAYDQADFQTAAARFRGCLRDGFAWKPFLYWMACQFPPGVVTRARHLKQCIPGAHALAIDGRPVGLESRIHPVYIPGAHAPGY